MEERELGDLKARFMRLERGPKAAAWFDLLVGLYSEPHRHYHTIDHIVDLLARLDASKVFGVDTIERIDCELAIWFHDAIYDVRSKTNEADSADLMRTFHRTIGINSYLEGVIEAIVATTHQGKPPTGQAAMLMVDLDLAGFADPWERFDANNAKIRKEYSIYNDEQYRWGRAAFLSGLLARPRIYSITADLEAPARANIVRHIRDLIA